MALIGVLGRETISVAGTAIGITNSLQRGAAAALITVEDAQIRYTLDGTTATVSIGHEAEPGDVINLADASQVRDFSAFNTGGTASLQATVAELYAP